MTLTPELTASEYTKLQGASYAAMQFISLCPNTNVVSTTVDSVPFFASFAEIDLVATPTGARVGQLVLISKTNNRRKAYFRGYVRLAPAGNTLYINETSAGIQAGDYIWIVDDYALFNKLAVDDGATYKKNYNESYHVPRPVLYNLPTAIAGEVDATGFLEYDFAPAYFLPNPLATTISTWLWEEGDGTYTFGSSASEAPHIKFPPGFRWVHVSATDDAGQTQIFHIQVYAHDPSSYPAKTGFRGAQIDGNVTEGFNATLSAFDGVDEALDRTAIVIWSREWYAGAEGHLYGGAGRVEFTGRFRSEANSGQSDLLYSWLSEVNFTAEGIGTQLASLASAPIALRDVSNPTVWDELKNQTLWRAACHYLDTHSTFFNLHSLNFDSIADTFLAKELGTGTGGVLGVMNELQQAINAAMEFSYTGACEIVRMARYLSQTARDALPTLADWDNQDLYDLGLDRDYGKPIGAVFSDGAYYNQSSGKVVPLLSLAPGHAQGEGGDVGQLPGQVLEANVVRAGAQSELNFRCGQHYAAVNPREALTVSMPGGYHPFLPSNAAYYTWTLDSSLAVRGLTYTTANNWLLANISWAHDNDTGGREVQHVYEAIGDIADSGQTDYPPAPNTVLQPFNQLPAFQPFPNFPTLPDIYLPDGYGPGDVAPYLEKLPQVYPVAKDGNTALVGTEKNLWLATAYLTGSPSYADITPVSSGEIKAACWDIDFIGAYCLVYDGSTNSHIYYTTNGLANPVVWAQGATLEGEYNELRLGSVPGEIYAYSNGQGVASSFEHTFDFTVNDGGFIQIPVTGDGTYIAATGWRTDTVGSTEQLQIQRTLAARTIVNIELTYSCGAVAVSGSRWIMRNGAFILQLNLGVGGPFVTNDATSSVVTTIGLLNDTNATAPRNWITKCVVTGLGSDPWTGGASLATTGYSTDHGETIDSVEVVGVSPAAIGGVDTIKVGAVILAGQAAQVRTAQSGGAYGDEVNGAVSGSNPTLLLIPYFRFNSTTKQNNHTTPEYLLGVDVAVGGAALWRVTDSGKTDISATISAVLGLILYPNVGAFSWFDNGKLAALVDVAGDTHLITSINGGTTWTDRGQIGDASQYIRMRKGDTQSVQLFYADGDNGPSFSLDFGATLINNAWPSTDKVIIVEPYG